MLFKNQLRKVCNKGYAEPFFWLIFSVFLIIISTSILLLLTNRDLMKIIGFGFISVVVSLSATWLIYNKVVKQKSVSNEFRKDGIRLMFSGFIAVFLLFGTLLAEYASLIDEPKFHNKYEYELRLIPPDDLSLNDYHITFDFHSKKGQIFFEISDMHYSNEKRAIVLNLFNGSKITGVSLTLTNKSEYVLETREESLILSNFDNLNNKNIEINFTSDIVPQGDFYFATVTNRSHHYNEFIRFDLGQYVCSDYCFTPFEDAYIALDEDRILVNAFTNKDNPHDTFHLVRFVLNTSSFKYSDTKARMINLHIGLLLSFIVIIIEIAITSMAMAMIALKKSSY